MITEEEYEEGEGLEEEQAEAKPQLEEDDRKLTKYFLDQITIAKRQREKFWKRGEKALKEYQGEFSGCDEDTTDTRRINIFNSIVNTGMPAYYARTPKSEVQLREKLGDALDAAGAQAIEAGSQYCLEECQDFDAVAERSVKSLLTVGQGTLWERYEVETEPEIEEIPVIQGQDGAWYYSDGAPVEDADIGQDQETGQFFVVQEYERVVSEKSVTEFVHYKDYLQSPARYESEVTWKARRIYLSRTEYQELFKQDGNLYYLPVDELDFNTIPEEMKELGLGKDSESMQGKLAVWELWSKPKEKIIYLTEDYHDGPLLKSEPPVKLKGFFPCAPCLVANEAQDQAIPVCDHHIIKDLLKEVERLTTRMHACAEAIRVTAAHDKALGDVLSQMFETDFEFIPIDDFKAFAEKGSLSDRVMFAPVKPFADALQVLGNLREDALKKIYEVTGSSDIMRGATDSRETAAAQQIKGSFANLRFSHRQRQIQKFFAAQLRIKAEFMCTLFADDTLYEICKGREIEKQLQAQATPQQPPMPPQAQGQPMPPMPQMAPPQPPAPQYSFGDVLEYIRNPMKFYKIDIETDSMIALDEAAEREQVANYINSIGGLISQTLPVMSQYPSLADLFVEVLDLANGAYRNGKRLDTLLETLLPAFKKEAAANAQREQAGANDPKQAEAQVKLQVAQIEAQSDQMKAQAEVQAAQMDAQLKQMEMSIKQQEIEIERMKIQLEYAKLGKDVQMKDLEMTAQAARTQGTIAKEQMDTQQEAIKLQAAVQKSAQQPQPSI
jgi:hypothetical protein